MTALAAIFSLLLGLAIGSFLNVCITRLPLGESVAWPGSHCRECGTPIAPRHNVPLLSWAMLRGRCAHCNTRIPWRYPVVEALTGMLFLACWLRFGFSLHAGTMAALCSLLVALAFTDAETMLLPDRLTIPGIAVGVFIAMFRATGTFEVLEAGLEAIGDAAIAAGFLLLIRWAYWAVRRQPGMGLGDVKLLAMIAGWIGLQQTALVFLLGVVTAALYGVGVLVTSRRGRSAQISAHAIPGHELPLPLGTFLSAAAIYSIFLGERTVGWYLHLFP